MGYSAFSFLRPALALALGLGVTHPCLTLVFHNHLVKHFLTVYHLPGPEPQKGGLHRGKLRPRALTGHLISCLQPNHLGNSLF